MSNQNIGKTVLTTIEGEAIAAKNGLHAFGMRFPLTLALVAFVFGNVLGALLHV